jgi:hypothetical protein
VDLDIGPEVLAFSNHTRPPANKRGGYETGNLDRVRVLDTHVDEAAGRQSINCGRKDYVASDIPWRNYL